MNAITNNGITIKNPKGCWKCKYLEYYEKDSYESLGEEGWFCDFREDEEIQKFKDFPCNRKLKCFTCHFSKEVQDGD